MKKKHFAAGFLLIAFLAMLSAGCKKSNDQSAVSSSGSTGKSNMDQVDVIDVGGSSESGVIVDFNTGAVVGTHGEKPSGSSSNTANNNDRISSETPNISSTDSGVNSDASSVPSKKSETSELTTMDGNTPWE